MFPPMNPSAKRRSASNMARLIQIEIVFAAAIYRSPIIGYGSWAPNSDVAREILAVGRGAGLVEGSRHDDPSKIGAHSQILQAWYEGGNQGSVLFINFINQLDKGVKHMAMHAPWTMFNALFYVALIWSLWAAAFSPFGGEERRGIGLAVAALCVCETKRQEWLEPVTAEYQAEA